MAVTRLQLRQQRPVLQTLPNEVLSSVADELGYADLMSIRLVNRHLAAVGLRALDKHMRDTNAHRTIKITPIESELETVLAIFNSVLRTYCHHIVLESQPQVTARSCRQKGKTRFEAHELLQNCLDVLTRFENAHFLHFFAIQRGSSISAFGGSSKVVGVDYRRTLSGYMKAATDMLQQAETRSRPFRVSFELQTDADLMYDLKASSAKLIEQAKDLELIEREIPMNHEYRGTKSKCWQENIKYSPALKALTLRRTLENRYRRWDDGQHVTYLSRLFDGGAKGEKLCLQDDAWPALQELTLANVVVGMEDFTNFIKQVGGNLRKFATSHLAMRERLNSRINPFWVGWEHYFDFLQI